MIEIKNLKASVDEKEILKGLNPILMKNQKNLLQLHTHIQIHLNT